MKKIILLFILFIGLGVFAFLLIKREGKETTSYDEYAGNFAVKETNRIERIFIANRAAENIDLKRQRDHWIINDKYRVRKANIDLLLQTIRLVEVKYIPAKAANENIAKEMAVYGIKVELYDHSGDILKTYYLGGTPPDERGTYMIMDGADQPFVVHVPGMEGSIRPRFEIPESHWRDRYFLDVKPEEIQKVTVEYPREKNSSFVLEKEGRDFSVEPYFSFTPRQNGEVDSRKADAFMQSISQAACESYENQYPAKDSIRSMLPWSNYKIYLNSGDSLRMTLYPTGMINQGDNASGVHRFFIDCSTGDFMLAQYEVLKELFRGYAYFIQ